VTDTQLYLAIGVSILANAMLIAVLIAYINARLEGASARSDARFTTCATSGGPHYTASKRYSTRG
jgi:hypothetical protein